MSKVPSIAEELNTLFPAGGFVAQPESTVLSVES